MQVAQVYVQCLRQWVEKISLGALWELLSLHGITEERKNVEDSFFTHDFQEHVCMQVYLSVNYILGSIVHRISCELANRHTQSVFMRGSALDYMA